jgi:hypothetical protein
MLALSELSSSSVPSDGCFQIAWLLHCLTKGSVWNRFDPLADGGEQHAHDSFRSYRGNGTISAPLIARSEIPVWLTMISFLTKAPSVLVLTYHRTRSSELLFTQKEVYS